MIEELNSLDELPHGWIRTQLDEIAEIILGQSPPSSTYNEDRKGLPFYQGKLEFGKLYPTPRKWCVAPKKIAEKGDVLISVRAPVGPTNICPEKSCIGRGLAAIRGLGGIGTFFIFYVLRTFEDEIARKGTGTTFSAIGGDKLKELEVPLPPLNEQVRIVARLEELFTRLDAGIEGLRKVRAQLKRYRQAVLKYAFEGKLTEEWRKTHKYAIEPATKLLQYIKEERKKKMRERYKERSLSGFNDLPELPDGWTWTNSGSLSWFVTSGSRDWKKYYSDSGSLFIRTQDINTNKLNLENVAHVTLPERIEGKRSLVEKNDILIIITGANVGKVALVEKDIGEAYVSQSVALMKLVMPETSKFVHFAMIADGFGKTSLDKLVYGMGRPVLSLENVQDVALPLAPLKEEQQIVNEIERKLSEADGVEKVVDKSLRYSESLRQSILKVAFEGKLASQDPNDEPAGKLLERIKGERAKSKGEKDTNRRKKNRPKQLELSTYVK